MTIRLGIAATAAAAICVGLAAAVSSLLTALAHPLSAVAVERLGDLFATVPFLVLGGAGLPLGAEAMVPRVQRALAVAWAALVTALCLAGPLVGPYAWFFEHATGRPADAWQASWTGIVAWAAPGGVTVDLGLARWPLLAGALATGTMALVRLGAGTDVRDQLVAFRRHLHLPRWHAPRSATS